MARDPSARRALAAGLVALLLAGCGGGGGQGPSDDADAGAVPPAFCRPDQQDDAGYAAPPGASTTALGPQPAAYELQAPAGGSRGVAIVLHGGGWVTVGNRQVVGVRPDADRWLARGWATANLDYRACGLSLADVEQMHDAIRARIGPEPPIVVVGESAGAQMALMMAILRPDSVRGVVAQAPPTDPLRLAEQTVTDPATDRPTDAPTRGLASQWHGVFGDGWLAVSPVRRAAELRARVVLARSTADPLIPAAQLTDMADALEDSHDRPWVRVLELAPGPVDFPHATISAAAERRFEAAEDALAAPWASGAPILPADPWTTPATPATPAAPATPPTAAAPAPPVPAAPSTPAAPHPSAAPATPAVPAAPATP